MPWSASHFTAEGYGPAFVDPSVGDGMKVLRLARDDVPIRGRVIDIQGRPVAGATVRSSPSSGTPPAISTSGSRP